MTVTSLVFDGVTVVDVEQGKLVSDQRVVIVGNRVQALGNSRTIGLPAGAQVVDARHKYLIPGLWDMHTHIAEARVTDQTYPLLLANGVTGIRDAGSAIPLDTLQQWRQEIVAGTRVGPPRQILSGRAIVGPRPDCNRDELFNFTGCVVDAADARTYVESLKADGVDMISLENVTARPVWFAIATAARRIGLPFGGFAEDGGVVTAIEAVDSGASVLENELGVHDCWTRWSNVDRCRQAAEQFRRRGLWFIPGLSAPSSLLMGRPALEIAWCLSDRGREFAGQSLLPGNWLRSCRSTTVTPDSTSPIAIAQQVGLLLLAGTDLGQWTYTGFPAGFTLHAELAMFAADGMTPLGALQSATLNPAKLLHATDSLGTVAVGKLADLILLDADPLADITNTTTIRAVVANGRYYDRATLDQLLTDAK